MEDKYMRAARAAAEKGTLERMADAIKAEIERPEPLVPGVRYKNTEANQKRVDNTKCYNVWGEEGTVYIGYLIWERWNINVNGGYMADETITSFSLIPDGEVQDE
jgi:hypothetical protein